MKITLRSFSRRPTIVAIPSESPKQRGPRDAHSRAQAHTESKGRNPAGRRTAGQESLAGRKHSTALFSNGRPSPKTARIRT